MAQPHLIGAIRAYLLAQPAIAGQIAGGIREGQAARDDALPYLVLRQTDMDPMRLFGGREIQQCRIEFATFHTGRAAVEAIGNLIRDAILPTDDMPAWSPLAIAAGWTDVNRQPAGGDAIEIDEDARAAAGKDVWACRRPITWTIARG